MKKALFILLVFASTSFAESPRFTHQEATTQQEMESAYQLIGSKVPLSLLTTNTAGQILTGQGTGSLPVWSSTSTLSIGKILQIVVNTADGSATTANTTFTNTNLNGTINIISATSKILIMAFGSGFCTSAGGLSQYTLARGATNLGATSGFATVNIGIASAVAPLAMATVDSPLMTGTTTYNVRYQAVSAGSAGWSQANQRSVIILAEIGQ